MPASQGATSARCARLAEKTLRAAAAGEHAAVSSACASACKFHSRAAAGGALDAALALAQALVLMCLREPRAQIHTPTPARRQKRTELCGLELPRFSSKGGRQELRP